MTTHRAAIWSEILQKQTREAVEQIVIVMKSGGLIGVALSEELNDNIKWMELY